MQCKSEILTFAILVRFGRNWMEIEGMAKGYHLQHQTAKNARYKGVFYSILLLVPPAATSERHIPELYRTQFGSATCTWVPSSFPEVFPCLLRRISAMYLCFFVTFMGGFVHYGVETYWKRLKMTKIEYTRFNTCMGPHHMVYRADAVQVRNHNFRNTCPFWSKLDANWRYGQGLSFAASNRKKRAL